MNFPRPAPPQTSRKSLPGLLVEEMQAMGSRPTPYMDGDGYVYGTVPGDPGKPVIG